MTTFLTSDSGKTVVQVATVQVPVDDAPQIRAGIPIGSIKPQLIDLFNDQVAAH